MSSQLIPWKPDKLGEPPPVRPDCPLRVGEPRPGLIRVSWPRRARAAG